MRTLRLLALALLLALPAAAQSRTGYFAIGYDVASTTMTYCVLTGQRGDVFNDPYFVNIPIETSGSSKTVTAVTATTAPFARVAVGDSLIVVKDNGARDIVWVEAKASNDQVTVEPAVDWSAGYAFSFLDLICGTGTDDGWATVSQFGTVSMTMQYEDGDLGGLDVVWECKDNGLISEPVQVYPGPASDCGFGTLNTDVCTYATTGDRQTVVVTFNTFAYCRMGLAYRTSDGGTAEVVHGVIAGR